MRKFLDILIALVCGSVITAVLFFAAEGLILLVGSPVMALLYVVPTIMVLFFSYCVYQIFFR